MLKLKTNIDNQSVLPTSNLKKLQRVCGVLARSATAAPVIRNSDLNLRQYPCQFKVPAAINKEDHWRSLVAVQRHRKSYTTQRLQLPTSLTTPTVGRQRARPSHFNIRIKWSGHGRLYFLSSTSCLHAIILVLQCPYQASRISTVRVPRFQAAKLPAPVISWC